MSVIGQIGQWFDRRLQLAAPIREVAEHPVPRNTASWFYVFGSAALTVFLLQLMTGILLALIYVPSAGEAWSSLQALNHDVTLGWFIRALHGWGSNFMVAIVLIHMVQVFLFGAHKFRVNSPGLLACSLLMTLAWPSADKCFASIRTRLGIGNWRLDRESRPHRRSRNCEADARRTDYCRCHAFTILCAARLCNSGMLIGFVALHLLMVIKLGINEWPMPDVSSKKRPTSPSITN